MEIYREQPEDIGFKVPPGTTQATASITRDGVAIGTDQTWTAADGEELSSVTVSIPYKAIRYDGKITVSITSVAGEDAFINQYTLDVVTPVISLGAITEIAGIGTTPQKAREIERAVRVIIEAYTGQRFGLSLSIESVMGQGEERLQLPKKLIAYRTISVVGMPIRAIQYNLTGDGWFLETINPEWLEIKEAPPEEMWPVYVNGPIRVPAWYRATFTKNQTYKIDGLWGWESVPTDIEEAARLLANDYACNQAAYRDRYLDIIKTSDWTMQYNARAWEGTGNARADLILGQYKRPFLLIV